MWRAGGGAGQLGHNDRKRRLVPSTLLPQSLGDTRAGRCRHLSQDRAVALAMACHSRLGEKSALAQVPPELVCRIAHASRPWTQSAAVKVPGILRMLGGGFAESLCQE